MRLVADLCARLFWTWDEVLDQVDHPRLEALRRSWEDCPPLCEVVARAAGIKPKEKSSSRGGKNFGELIGMFPTGIIK